MLVSTALEVTFLASRLTRRTVGKDKTRFSAEGGRLIKLSTSRRVLEIVLLVELSLPLMNKYFIHSQITKPTRGGTRRRGNIFELKIGSAAAKYFAVWEGSGNGEWWWTTFSLALLAFAVMCLLNP